jgi:hypothetical protein
MKYEFKVVRGGCKPDKEGRAQFIFDDINDRDIENKINTLISEGWEPYNFTFPTAYIQDSYGNARASVFLTFRKACESVQTTET